MIPLYLYPSLPIGITLMSIGGEEIVFNGSNIDTDSRFGCIAYGIKPKKINYLYYDKVCDSFTAL